MNNNDLKLIKSENFGEIECGFYENKTGEIFVTRKQIGQALEYANPSDAIKDIHKRYKERLDKFSRLVQITLPSGGTQKIVFYNAKGIYEICRYSKQPKANDFYDWVYDVLESVRKTGKYEIPKNPYETLKLMFDVVENHENKIDSMSKDIIEIKENSLLNPGEYNYIGCLVTDKIRKIVKELGLKYCDCRKVKVELFKSLNGEIKKITGIETRSQLKQKDFKMVVDFIKNWEPSKATMIVIEQLNV